MSESDVDVESVGSGSNSDAETETAADESQNESVHFSDDDDDDIEELMSPSSNNDDASVKEGVEGDQGGDRPMARARYSGARCRRIVRAGRSRSRPAGTERCTPRCRTPWCTCRTGRTRRPGSSPRPGSRRRRHHEGRP